MTLYIESLLNDKPAWFLHHFQPMNNYLKFLAVSGFLLTVSAKVLAGEWQPHADILAVAASTARSGASLAGGRVKAVADKIDSRLRLAACSRPLVGDIPYGNKKSSRVTVEVQCLGTQPWKVYVPVKLALFQKVVIVNRPLPRGAILTKEAISIAERDIGSLSRGYLLNVEHAIGQRLRRAVMSGTVMTPSTLESPPMIKRGQRVTIEARSGAISVRTTGIAKSDGVFGQVINVEGIRSKRKIQAIVRSAQSVEVLLN